MHKYLTLTLILFGLTVFGQNSKTIDIQWSGTEKSINSLGIESEVPLASDGFIDDEKALPYIYYRILLPSKENKIRLTLKAIKSQETTFSTDKLDGASILHSVQYTYQNHRKYANIKIYPLIETNGKTQLLQSIKIDYAVFTDKEAIAAASRYYEHSVLKEGQWFRFMIKKDGLHKITYNDLVHFGLDPESIDPGSIRIYGNGGDMLSTSNNAFRHDDLYENAIMVIGEEDGRFDENDLILFYGDSPVKWDLHKYKIKSTHKVQMASTENPELDPFLSSGAFRFSPHLYDTAAYYFLTVDKGPGLRVQTQETPQEEANYQTSQSLSRQVYSEENYNLAHTGNVWFSEIFEDANDHIYSFQFPNLLPERPLRIRTAAASRSYDISTFRFFNGQDSITGIYYPELTAQKRQYIYGFYEETSKSFYSNDGNISLNIRYSRPEINSKGWIDYVEINAFENIVFDGKELFFRNIECIGDTIITKFSVGNASENTIIWDITNPQRPESISYSINNGIAEFLSKTDTLKEFYAFNTEQAAQEVVFIEEVENQDLHGIPVQDMVILTHPDFRAQAEELANFHRTTDQFDVLVVEPQQIYNEFSSGSQDPMAIRLLMKMMYDRSENIRKPGYLLLLGDGSYDPKGRISPNHNFIPTVQSDNSLNIANSFVTDDFYGLLDDEEGDSIHGQSVDIGIGRFPVLSVEEAEKCNEKIFHYHSKTDSTRGHWRNSICLVADDADRNLHLNQAEDLADIITETASFINLNKIYSDAYIISNTSAGKLNAGAKEAIHDQMNKGCLVMNYTGHGGELGWSAEDILDNSDIFSWRNENTMPLFITATCEFSRYDNPWLKSAGEYVFLQPYGGAIAMFTTTRLAYATSNSGFNKAVYDNMFSPNENYKDLRLGDLLRFSKNDKGNNDKILNITLLGDPALRLPVAPKEVVIRDITNMYDGNETTLLQGKSKLQLNGEILSGGAPDEHFNGQVSITVYDRLKNYRTLGQDAESYPVDFSLQKDILHQGEAIVRNGRFEHIFMMPSDINPELSQCKISFYAIDSLTEAKGTDTTFSIGGIDPLAPIDDAGPEILLKINNQYFESGDPVNEDALLLANLSDESGINPGNNLGKDILLRLDNDDNTIILNDYFRQNTTNYASGTISFSLTGLSAGEHFLRLKAWDNQNNSSESTISFYVVDDAEMDISNLQAQPNPFKEYTEISFDHELPPGPLDLKIKAFDMHGRLVTDIETSTYTRGKSIEPIRWYGTNSGGSKLPQGFYVLEITIKNQYNKEIVVHQKVIIAP